MATCGYNKTIWLHTSLLDPPRGTSLVAFSAMPFDPQLLSAASKLSQPNPRRLQNLISDSRERGDRSFCSSKHLGAVTPTRYPFKRAGCWLAATELNQKSSTIVSYSLNLVCCPFLPSGKHASVANVCVFDIHETYRYSSCISGRRAVRLASWLVHPGPH